MKWYKDTFESGANETVKGQKRYTELNKSVNSPKIKEIQEQLKYTQEELDEFYGG